MYLFVPQKEERTVNHHGSERTVGPEDETLSKVFRVSPTPVDLIARDEEKEVRARKDFYKKIEEELESNKRCQSRLKFCKFIAKKFVPLVVIGFTIGYWYYGLSNMAHR